MATNNLTTKQLEDWSASLDANAAEFNKVTEELKAAIKVMREITDSPNPVLAYSFKDLNTAVESVQTSINKARNKRAEAMQDFVAAVKAAEDGLVAKQEASIDQFAEIAEKIDAIVF